MEKEKEGERGIGVGGVRGVGGVGVEREERMREERWRMSLERGLWTDMFGTSFVLMFLKRLPNAVNINCLSPLGFFLEIIKKRVFFEERSSHQ